MTLPAKCVQDQRPPTVHEAIADASYGPAMSALNERQRAFVAAIFEAPRKHGAAAFAARAAGYGTPTSSIQSIASIASRLCSDDKIQLAIQEESRKRITTLGPLAVRALKNLLGTPAHKDHGRAVGILMDRIAPVESTHTVRVNHDLAPGLKATADVLKRIAELAALAGIDPSRLIDVTPVSKSETAA